jgi:hypothetical protein
MPYFRELPNIQYASVFGGRKSANDYNEAKNLFRRAKLREDIKEAVTAFTYYQIVGDERPDQIAQKLYDDSNLDWIILLTNNIIDLREQWPLNNDSLYKYLLDKYGSEEELAKVHHYETVELTDDFGRIIVEGGLQVDNNFSEVIEKFPNPKSNTTISVNLNQQIRIYGRDIRETVHYITDIQTNFSFLKIKSPAGGTTDVNILNSLSPWPSGWGGSIIVKQRNGNEVEMMVEDIILDNKIRIPERLYEITGTLIDGVLVPTFNFTNELPTN